MRLRQRLVNSTGETFLLLICGASLVILIPCQISFGHIFTCSRDTIGIGITPSSAVDGELLEQRVCFPACCAMRLISSSFGPNRYCSLIY